MRFSAFAMPFVLCASLTAACGMTTADATETTGDDESSIATVSSALRVDRYSVTVSGNAIYGAELAVTGVNAGDHIVVQDESGRVYFNVDASVSCTNTGIPFYAPPDGLDRATFYENPDLRLCYGDDQACNDPLPNKGHAGLLLRLGSTYRWVGGRGIELTAARTGKLYLGINDCVATRNTGSFKATVIVTRAI